MHLSGIIGPVLLDDEGMELAFAGLNATARLESVDGAYGGVGTPTSKVSIAFVLATDGRAAAARNT